MEAKYKTPFIQITGDNCVVKDCETRGDRPAVGTSGKNTRLIRLKAFGQNVKEHPVKWMLGIVASIIVGVVLLVIEYKFFIQK